MQCIPPTQGSKTELSYLCSSSRMDRITPDVDGFCCTVATKVKSLLFRNSWINFSLTWGAAWISLCVSRSPERRVGETGVGVGGRRRRRGKKRRGSMRRKRREDAQLKMPRLGSRLHFSLPPLVNTFRFQTPATTPYSSLIQSKTQKCHPGHRAHLSLWHVHNWPVVFWWEF